MRVKKIRGLPVITMLLVMGSICFAAIEPEVTVVVFDPNDPNLSPSNCFVPTWERIIFYATLLNPEEVSYASGYNSTQTLSLNFNFYKVDIQNLISRTDFLHATEARAVDEQNNVYTYESSYPLVTIKPSSLYSFDEDNPAYVNINMPMDPNTGYPALFSQISLSFKGLFARKIRTIKVPFQESGQWIEILPGYSIYIEKAEIEERWLSYSIKGKYIGLGEPFSRDYSLMLHESIPQCIDLGLAFLDENGDIISTSGSDRFSSDSGVLTTDYTFSGSRSGDGCDSVTTVQFKYAIDSYVDEMSYTLNDIPVPTF